MATGKQKADDSPPARTEVGKDESQPRLSGGESTNRTHAGIESCWASGSSRHSQKAQKRGSGGIGYCETRTILVDQIQTRALDPECPDQARPSTSSRTL